MIPVVCKKGRAPVSRPARLHWHAGPCSGALACGFKYEKPNFGSFTPHSLQFPSERDLVQLRWVI